jgi:dynein light intermediate chain, axonemal
MIPPQSSLVKYNSPILVNSTKEKVFKQKPKASSQPPKSNQTQPPEPLKPTLFTGSHTQSQSQTEDILNSILPPKEWTEDGQLWVQYVSSTPATRLDVVNLQEQLDLRLQQRQARETGICPVREELYAQCFGPCVAFKTRRILIEITYFVVLPGAR